MAVARERAEASLVLVELGHGGIGGAGRRSSRREVAGVVLEGAVPDELDHAFLELLCSALELLDVIAPDDDGVLAADEAGVLRLSRTGELLHGVDHLECVAKE